MVRHCKNKLKFIYIGLTNIINGYQRPKKANIKSLERPLLHFVTRWKCHLSTVWNSILPRKLFPLFFTTQVRDKSPGHEEDKIVIEEPTAAVESKNAYAPGQIEPTKLTLTNHHLTGHFATAVDITVHRKRF